jgi:hypothetical protein
MGEPVGLQRRRPALFEPPVLATGLAPAGPEHAPSEPLLPETHEERLTPAAVDLAGDRPAPRMAAPALPMRAPPSDTHSDPEPERGEGTPPRGLTAPANDLPLEAIPVERPRRPRRRAAQPEPVTEAGTAPPGALTPAVPPENHGSADLRHPPPRPAEPRPRSELGLHLASSAPVPATAPLQPAVLGEARLRGDGARRGEIDERGRPSARSAITPAFAPLARHEIPRLQPAAALGQQPPAPSPTIHVTIGRVEVRAVQPQPVAAARQQRPTGPRLSLEEYLKLRAGGGR